ncbi:hypothetical protein LNV08_06550 [Paucibacter sp. TC2R-5]|uniref:hypothetical protein n=1 Tax=Paucibacter sp. TC2R-5 TaxID=2893555 RepID=UPI0021E3868A|nr:hypothetical protein [Paucibacter sp. TC2R-5]MCV2358634.1 hypothetical protein [Paucibacter sp. TC2R-5]
MTETSRTKVKRDHMKWIEQYTQQARDRVQGLRDDPKTDPKHQEGVEALLKIIDPDFFAVPAESPLEREDPGYVIEGDYQYPPFIPDDEVLEDERG